MMRSAGRRVPRGARERSLFVIHVLIFRRMQSADLWKSRVQHLRQYYCFNGHKPKQRSSPAISRHVWFIPLILTLWWLLIAVMFIYTLKMEHLLSAGMPVWYQKWGNSKQFKLLRLLSLKSKVPKFIYEGPKLN